MNRTTKIYWLHALTPIHVGSGSGVGFIDMPIMREKLTGWPMVPGSAVKGVLRDFHEHKNTPSLNVAFGSAGKDSDTAGSLVFTDARVILLPIRSLYGTFAYVTAPLVLKGLSRDLNSIDIDTPKIPDIVKGKINCGNSSSKIKDGKNTVYLEDLNYESVYCEHAGRWTEYFAQNLYKDTCWKEVFTERFAIVDDESFNFLCQTGTEVNARIRIDDTNKIVDIGALWYEESLPAETILYGLTWCDKIYTNEKKLVPKEMLDIFCSHELLLQIGGKATVGKGRVRCIFTDSKEE